MVAEVMPPETVADRIEAECRVAMSRVPKPESARGWLTARARRDALDWIDCLLDEHNLLTRGR